MRHLRSLLLVAVLLGYVSMLWSQQVQEADPTDKINALKRELEESRQLRDRVLAKRWEDKRKYADSREAFNTAYDELKVELEAQNIERTRLEDQKLSLLRDLEIIKAKQETENANFSSLGYGLKTHARGWADASLQKFPVLVPERQAKFNQLFQQLEKSSNDPILMWSALRNLYIQEIKLTRQIVADQKGFILADGTPGTGMFLRIGMIGAAYQDKTSHRSGILLRAGLGNSARWQWRDDVTTTARKSLEQFFTTLEQVKSGKKNWSYALLPVDVLQNKSLSSGYVENNQVSFAEHFWRMFKQGGLVMYPLALAAILGLILCIDRYIVIWRRSINPEKLKQKLKPVIEAKNWEAAIAISQKSKSSIGNTFTAIFKQANGPRKNGERAVRESMMKEIPYLEKRMIILTAIGGAAPLMGLLGTVSGMIALFNVITDVGTNDPRVLAGGISEALVATASGLVIAIPILLIQGYLNDLLDRIQNDIAAESTELLNTIWPDSQTVA